MTPVVTVENMARAFVMWTALAWAFAFLREWRITGIEDIGIGIMAASSTWVPVAFMFPLCWGPIMQRVRRATTRAWVLVVIGAALMSPLGAWPPALFAGFVGQVASLEPNALRTLRDAAFSDDARPFYVLYALLGAAMSLRFAVAGRAGSQPARPAISGDRPAASDLQREKGRQAVGVRSRS